LEKFKAWYWSNTGGISIALFIVVVAVLVVVFG
jgi:hypothetical protein